MNPYTALSFPGVLGDIIVDVGELVGIVPGKWNDKLSGSFLYVGTAGGLFTTSSPTRVMERVARAIEVRRGEEEGDRRELEAERLEALVSRLPEVVDAAMGRREPSVPANAPGASQHLSDKSKAAARGALNKLARQLGEAAGWLGNEPNAADLAVACNDAARFVQASADELGADPKPEPFTPEPATPDWSHLDGWRRDVRGDLPTSPRPAPIRFGAPASRCATCGAESRVQAVAKCVRATGTGQFHERNDARPLTMQCQLEELPRALEGEAPPRVAAAVLASSPWPELSRAELHDVLRKVEVQVYRLCRVTIGAFGDAVSDVRAELSGAFKHNEEREAAGGSSTPHDAEADA